MLLQATFQRLVDREFKMKSRIIYLFIKKTNKQTNKKTVSKRSREAGVHFGS